MSIFLRSSMCFHVPHLCSKIPKINIQGFELGRTQCKGRVAGNPWFTWCNPGVGITTRPVYTVCASAVISPLRQLLDSYAKTRFKMCHTFKHLFLCSTFCCRLILLSLSLYIELALVCCTNPNNVNCFGTIFPNLNFVFASNLSRPPGPYWIQKLLNCQTRTHCQCYSIHPDWGATKNSAVTLGLRNNMLSIHQMSARTNEDKTTLIYSYSRTVSWMVSSCSWRPLDWRIRHSHLAPTLFHSLVPWWRPRRIRPQITRLSQLENSATGTWPIYKNSIIPDWFEKWGDIKFLYMC